MKFSGTSEEDVDECDFFDEAKSSLLGNVSEKGMIKGNKETTI